MCSVAFYKIVIMECVITTSCWFFTVYMVCLYWCQYLLFSAIHIGRWIWNWSHRGSPVLDENTYSFPLSIGEWYPSGLRVCEPSCGGEVSWVLLLPFQEESSKKPSVNVAPNGDTDFRSAMPHLDCGVFSSSSEEMTCIIQDRVFKGPNTCHVVVNPQVCFDWQTDKLDIASNAKWRIGLPQDASLYWLLIVHHFELPHSDYRTMAVYNMVSLLRIIIQYLDHDQQKHTSVPSFPARAASHHPTLCVRADINQPDTRQRTRGLDGLAGWCRTHVLLPRANVRPLSDNRRGHVQS